MSPRVTFLITDLDRGGSPLLLADLAPGLLAKGFDVDVVSIAREGEVAGLLRRRGVPVASLLAEGPGDLNVVPRFVRHLRRQRPHIVASILIHANLLATLARPFISRPTAWIHSIHTLQERPRWHWYLQGVLCQFADGFIAPSRAVIHKLEGFGPVPRAQVIPNGIDVARFQDAPAIPMERRPWPEDALVVGYVGRFDPVKRLPLLMEGCALLIKRQNASEALHLALVGYGPQERELRHLGKELGITERVHFVGATNEPERWYKTFDLFCSPSPAEGFGLTLAEAASAGIPVIACRTAAVLETLEDAIWLPEDADALDVARAIEGAGRVKSRSNPEKYSLAAMIERYASYFHMHLPGRSG